MIIIKEIPIIDAAANSDTAYSMPYFVDRFEGTLDGRDDEDWISIDLVAGETYEINLAGNGDNGAADTILTIYNSAGEQVARNDDIDTSAGNRNSMVTITPDSSGTYYIGATSYTANPAQDNSGDYVVTVSERSGSGLLESYRDSETGVEVTLAEDSGVLALEGSEHDDVLTGNDGVNWLFGNGGEENTLHGGGGDDWLFTGTGYNILEGGGGADIIVGDSDPTYVRGFETASYESSPEGVEVNLGSGLAAGGDAEGDTLFGIDGVIGSAHEDVLTGNEIGNEVLGGAGDDVLMGGGLPPGFSYFDYLEGGPGADTLIGSDGIVYAGYIESEAGVEVRLYDGTSRGGDAEGDTFESINSLFGSNHDDILAGDENFNVLVGSDGNDVIEGKESFDSLFGDGFSGNTGGDDELNGGEGDDYLQGGPGADVLQGGPGNDSIVGDSFEPGIEGGDDELDGGDGDDQLAGGPGADVLKGGAGTDDATYSTSDAGVVVRLHNAVARGGYAEGDTFANMETVEYTDADGNTQSVQVPDIENLRGSQHDDILAGDIRDNVIRGRGGNDTLYGGPDGGNDELHGDDGDDKVYGGKGNDDLYGNAGTDTIYGGPGNDNLLGGPGADTLIGGDGHDGAAYWDADSGVEVRLHDGVTRGEYAEGDTFESIERLNGSNHDDILEGDSNDNALHGNAGNDVLDGREGNDWLAGEEGADVLRGGEGHDIAAYYGSDAAVEVRLYDGTAKGGYAEGDTYEDIEGLFGSMHDDSLVGDVGHQSIEGFHGNDVLDGREGDDRFSGGEGDDTFVFAPGNGYDHISDFGNGDDNIDLTAFENIESIADLAIQQQGNDVVIDLSGHGGGDIRLENFNEADIMDAHFIF